MSNKDRCDITKLTTAEGETAIQTGGGVFYGVILNSNLTADASCLCEDGTTEIITYQMPGTDDGRNFALPVPTKFTGTLNCTVLGTGAEAFIMHGK